MTDCESCMYRQGAVAVQVQFQLFWVCNECAKLAPYQGNQTDK